jgi:hypothetical protein
MSEVWLSSEDRHGNHKPGITELTSYVAHQRPVVEELAVATFGHEERGRTIPLSDLLATRVGRTSPHDDRFQAAFETLRNTDNPPDIEDALRFFATHGTTSAQVRIRIGTSTKDTRTLVPEVHDYRAFNPGDFGLGIANDTLE